MEDSFEDETLLLFLLRRRRRRKGSKLFQQSNTRAKPKFWVRSIFQKRESLGEYHRLIQELRIEDREYFFRFLATTENDRKISAFKVYTVYLFLFIYF